jgi:hypothetical protein
MEKEAAERRPEVFLRKADLNAQEAKEREKGDRPAENGAGMVQKKSGQLER